jgi:hypothetical protein
MDYKSMVGGGSYLNRPSRLLLLIGQLWALRMSLLVVTRELSDEDFDDLRPFEWSKLKKTVEEYGVRQVINEILDCMKSIAPKILPKKAKSEGGKEGRG